MHPCQVKIFTRSNSPRLSFIAGIILGDILGLNWEVVTDKRKLGKNPVINYSPDKIPGSFRIDPCSLLFEKGATPKEISVGVWKGLPVFFQTTPESDLPFDIFAASFFLVSRYEEYLKFKPDRHGRFPASSSLAFKQGFLDKPIIDLWTKEFSKALIRKHQVLTFRRNEFKALLTLDSDQPFAYLGKNLVRSFGGLINDITRRPGHAGERYRVIARGQKDPYEVYDYITEKIDTNNVNARFFFPVGNISKYDKNPSWKTKEYRELIKKMSAKYKTGFHPSYYASDNYKMFKTELSRLRTILGDEVTSSRYHFIRLVTPASYRQLAKAGIEEDYSMGYPDEPGFRAGIARPYLFYDVLEDKTENLRIVPFQVMDGTLYKYRKLGPDAAVDVIMNLINETRKAGGLFVSLWHNTSLLDNHEWRPWRSVFETMIKAQQS
jgi:hypothetical protein